MAMPRAPTPPMPGMRLPGSHRGQLPHEAGSRPTTPWERERELTFAFLEQSRAGGLRSRKLTQGVHLTPVAGERTPSALGSRGFAVKPPQVPASLKASQSPHLTKSASGRIRSVGTRPKPRCLDGDRAPFFDVAQPQAPKTARGDRTDSPAIPMPAPRAERGPEPARALAALAAPAPVAPAAPAVRPPGGRARPGGRVRAAVARADSPTGEPEPDPERDASMPPLGRLDRSIASPPGGACSSTCAGDSAPSPCDSRATTRPPSSSNFSAARVGWSPSLDDDETLSHCGFSAALSMLDTSALCSTPSRSAGSARQLRWKRGDCIGSGSFGSVFKAQIVETGEIIAVKETKIDAKDPTAVKYRDVLRKELDILLDLHHPNIVRCRGHDYEDEQLYVYLEFVPWGSLRNRLKEFGPLSTPVLRKATVGLLKGIHYLHEHDPPVVHRDLKGANVLVDGSFNVKIADFGMSKRSVNTMSMSVVGSLHWVAPEVLSGDGHGRPGDIWSLGCVVIEMATAQDPWGKGAFDNQLRGIHFIVNSGRTPPVPDSLPDLGRDFVARCTQRNPDDRPTATELLHSHGFAAAVSGVGSRPMSRCRQVRSPEVPATPPPTHFAKAD